MVTIVESRDGDIERLQSIIRKLQRAQFGRRSERLDPDQLALALEDLDGDIARIQESCPGVGKQPSARPSHRKPLPDHLPREDLLLDIGRAACACCGDALHAIGESVSETLDWIPAQLGTTTAHVQIGLGNGVIITSSITNEAIDSLGLLAGDEITAVIDEADVIIGKKQR